jgi:hypothetical protein
MDGIVEELRPQLVQRPVSEQRSPAGGRNCSLLLSDEQAKRGADETVGLTKSVLKESDIGRRNIVRMADK